MNPGKLDTRCAFQSMAEVSDGGGGVETTWTTQFSRWGAFAFPNMRSNLETIAAGAVQSAVMADLLVRDDSDTATITPEWRLAAKGRTWNVRKVDPGDGAAREAALEALSEEDRKLLKLS